MRRWNRTPGLGEIGKGFIGLTHNVPTVNAEPPDNVIWGSLGIDPRQLKPEELVPTGEQVQVLAVDTLHTELAPLTKVQSKHLNANGAARGLFHNLRHGKRNSDTALLGGDVHRVQSSLVVQPLPPSSKGRRGRTPPLASGYSDLGSIAAAIVRTNQPDSVPSRVPGELCDESKTLRNLRDTPLNLALAL
jgi:hypothetical protein